jgi:Tol biopolymer transport system component
MVDVAGDVQEIEFSRDGAWMVVGVGEDLYLQATTPGSEPVPLIAEPGVNESNPAVSPDGRWISYVSNESGQIMVYVRPFPNVEDGKFTVSRGPARAPAWARDGTELFYTTADGRFMAVEVVPGTNFIMGERVQLFATAGLHTTNPHRQYDVHPDGDRFLMVELSSAAYESPLVVVENFGEELAGLGRD